ncbi:hypothetical protein BGZ65_001642 [Modicella reniformis]|uniref:F-box domain-containing protein n=1 Tax=Modicella reniformis TaxID=1440133 RepID=A0A9P6M9Z2_9FUNG|nr:hypothetical protein BGZ65_001642 [Modicella reniformis]
MADTNKTRVKSLRRTKGSSSKTIAMSLPEILSKILSFLDRRSLQACFLVSHTWHACSKPIAWQKYSITSIDFMNLLIRLDENKDGSNKNNNNNNKSTANAFFSNCCHIRSLTLHDGRGWLEIPTIYLLKVTQHSIEAFPGFAHRAAPAARLSNLVQLTIRTSKDKGIWQLRDNNLKLYGLVGGVLSQNPGVRDFTWATDCAILGQEFVDLVLKRTTRQLKKLSIAGDVGRQEMGILKYLITVNEKRERQRQRQQQQQQQHGRRLITAPGLIFSQELNGSVKAMTVNRNDSSHHDIDIDDDEEGNDGCSELEELVLEDPYHSFYFNSSSGLELSWLRDIPGVLPIRALTLLNYETDRYYEEPDPGEEALGFQFPNDSLLTLLSKCPNLERLRVTFEASDQTPRDTSTNGFIKDLAADPHYIPEPSSSGLIREQPYFVAEMYKSCPKLREIEFGMNYQLTDYNWIRMMNKYGPQLESLSIWGNVVDFNQTAFTEAIGQPVIPHTTRENYCHFRRLTRLNINGMRHLSEWASLALKHLPELKEFRARDVPLDGSLLIMKEEDGWICKGLEVLEIFILVPKQQLPPVESCNVDDDWRRPDNGSGSGMNNERITTKRQRENAEDTEGPRKKAKRRRKKKQTLESSMYNKQVQIEVCEMIGRLTKLRELRIEGKKDFMFGEAKWGCLELTLETGLDRLAPLQQNLEKLNVSTLQEKLNGRDELKWIARTWVHYQNRRWMRFHVLGARPLSSSSSTTTTTTTTTPTTTTTTTSTLSATSATSSAMSSAQKWKWGKSKKKKSIIRILREEDDDNEDDNEDYEDDEDEEDFFPCPKFNELIGISMHRHREILLCPLAEDNDEVIEILLFTATATTDGSGEMILNTWQK